jgi:endo-1,4-beta-xylanase
VVNEAVVEDGSLRPTLWLERVGPDYVDLAFRAAGAAAQQARLLYNDYGIEEPNPKSDGVYRLLSGMLARGVPLMRFLPESVPLRVTPLLSAQLLGSSPRYTWS